MSADSTATNHAASQAELGESCQIELLPFCDPTTERRIEELRKEGKVWRTSDTLLAQQRDLVQARNPRVRWTEARIAEGVSELRRDPRNSGVWAYYAWSGLLVSLLPEQQFWELKCDRNRHKISRDEQTQLADMTIGIVGLSAGMAVAHALALEGIGKSFRLADFDTLGLSNMNRLSASVADLGEGKAVLAARRLLEINPYLEITIFKEGVTEANLQNFFEGNQKHLSVLIEECDELWMKLRLREAAKSCSIPVVMHTSDRGMLDIERFDLEPDRPPFHGLIGSITSNELRQLSKKERIAFVLRILPTAQLSSSAIGSLIEIGESISTWPQLASSVLAGGAMVTEAVRCIRLNELKTSGRFFADSEYFLSPANALYQLPNQLPSGSKTSPLLPSYQSPLTADDQKQLTVEDPFVWMVGHAVHAPSGGNVQPWLFARLPDGLLGFVDPQRRSPLLDFDYGASLVALGAAAENAMIAASALDARFRLTELQFESWDQPVFSITCRSHEDRGPQDSLLKQITLRVTNRIKGECNALSKEQQQALQRQAHEAGAELQLLSSSDQLCAVANLIGESDQLRMQSQRMHAELVSEIRWDEAEAHSSRDGIDFDSLELGGADRSILQLLRQWPALKRLSHLGEGRGLQRNSIELVQHASAVGLLTFPLQGRAGWFQGGRALQRVWLKATELGMGLHPMSVLTFLAARFEAGDLDSFSVAERQRLESLSRRLRELFPKSDRHSDILLFRIVQGQSATARSLRRPINDVILSATRYDVPNDVH